MADTREIGDDPQIFPARKVRIEARISIREPIFARPAGSPGGCPATVSVPDVGRIKPTNIRGVVVFPAPFGAEETVDLATADGHVNSVDRQESAAKSLAQTVGFKNRRG